MPPFLPIGVVSGFLEYLYPHALDNRGIVGIRHIYAPLFYRLGIVLCIEALVSPPAMASCDVAA